MERQLSDGANKKPKSAEYRNKLRRSRSLGSLQPKKYAAKHDPDTVKWESGQFIWSMTQSASIHHYNEETEDRSHNYKDAEIPGYNHYLEHHGTLSFVSWFLMCCGLCIPCCCVCCDYFEDYTQHKNRPKRIIKHANIICKEDDDDEINNDIKPLLIANGDENGSQIAGYQPSSYQSVEHK